MNDLSAADGPSAELLCSNGTRVRIGPYWTRVILPDGTEIYGEPQRDDGQARTALELGYGEDVEAMCRDHDPLHAVLADFLGLPRSYSLADAAGILPPEDKWLADLEEAAVLAIQAFMRQAGSRLPGLEAAGTQGS
jgi:hypothetical protein